MKIGLIVLSLFFEKIRHKAPSFILYLYNTPVHHIIQYLKTFLSSHLNHQKTRILRAYIRFGSESASKDSWCKSLKTGLRFSSGLSVYLFCPSPYAGGFIQLFPVELDAGFADTAADLVYPLQADLSRKGKLRDLIHLFKKSKKCLER